MVATIKLGQSTVNATPLGLGTNAVGGHNLFPGLDDETGRAIVRAGLDNGINLLDTAFAYGLGASETLIGEAIKGYDRSKIVIATKAAQHVHADGTMTIDNSPAFLKQAVAESLQRLQTDYIDLFYIHFPDEHTPKDEAVQALNELKQAGKIRAIGVSNFSLAQLKEANQDGLVDVDEEQYSLLHRDQETERFAYLQAHQISFVPFFPLASGLLTGKYHEAVSFPADDIRHDNPDFQGARFAQIIAQIDQLTPIAAAHQATIAQVVLAWYIQNPAIAVVIPGAKRVKQVVSNAHALKINLSAAEYQQIDQIFR